MDQEGSEQARESTVMSRLTRLFCNVNALFCAHEWARRVDGRRVYLECVHCLSTTPGLELDQKFQPSSHSQQSPNFRAPKAA
jgi:hypothetical protein